MNGGIGQTIFLHFPDGSMNTLDAIAFSLAATSLKHSSSTMFVITLSIGNNHIVLSIVYKPVSNNILSSGSLASGMLFSPVQIFCNLPLCCHAIVSASCPAFLNVVPKIYIPFVLVVPDILGLLNA
jgi:hypothetical protein